MVNKKIRNATKVEYNGISFRSKSEMNIYKLFHENGIMLEYEPKPAILQEEFIIEFPFYDSKSEKNRKELINKIGQKIKPITYTPDFLFKGSKMTYIIEVKGFANDTFPLKKKLFLNLLNRANTPKPFCFAILYNQLNAKQLINVIKENEQS